MNDKNKYLLKNIGLLSLSSFSSKILVFLLVPLYTKVLSTSDFAIYDIAVSTVTLLSTLLTLNIIDAVMRYLMDNNTDSDQVAFIGFSLTLISILLFSFIILILHNSEFWYSISQYDVYIWMYYVAYTFNQFYIQMSKGLEKVKEISIAGVVSSLILVFGNVLFLIFFQYGLFGFFISSILSQFASLLYLSTSYSIKRIFWINNLDKNLFFAMINYSIPLIASVIGWWINSSSDKYVVTFFCGLSASGLLAVAYKIPAILNTLQGIFVQAWQISAIKEYNSTDSSIYYGNVFSIVNFLMCFTASVLILFTHPIACFLFSKSFYDAWVFVPFLLVSCVMNNASGFFGPILSAKKDSKSMAISALYGSISNLILNVLLVNYFGPIGVVFSTVIASFIIYEIRRKAVGNNIILVKYKRIMITWVLLLFQGLTLLYIENIILQIALCTIIFSINLDIVKIFIHKFCS